MSRYLVRVRTEDGPMWVGRGGLAFVASRVEARPMRLAEASALVEWVRASVPWAFGPRVVKLARRRFADRPSPRYRRFG